MESYLCAWILNDFRYLFIKNNLKKWNTKSQPTSKIETRLEIDNEIKIN